MLSIIKVISTELDGLSRRLVKSLRYGKSDYRTTVEVSPHGIDSNPIKDMMAIYARTGDKDGDVIIGYINKNKLAEVGETRLFSTNADGTLQTFIWLKSDGTMQIGGDADFMVRHAPLKAVVEEIQNDIATLKQAITTWVPVPNDGGAALKTGLTSWAGTALAQNIDDAKISEIKTL